MITTLVDLDEAVEMVLRGEITNATTVAGCSPPRGSATRASPARIPVTSLNPADHDLEVMIGAFWRRSPHDHGILKLTQELVDVLDRVVGYPAHVGVVELGVQGWEHPVDVEPVVYPGQVSQADGGVSPDVGVGMVEQAQEQVLAPSPVGFEGGETHQAEGGRGQVAGVEAVLNGLDRGRHRVLIGPVGRAIPPGSGGGAAPSALDHEVSVARLPRS